jgi:TolB protein
MAQISPHIAFSPIRLLIWLRRRIKTALAIWTINADGTNAKQITFDGNDFQPAISPHGGKIVFSSERGSDKNLYLIDADGKNRRQITFDKTASNGDPVWSNDGKKIAFIRYSGGSTWEFGQ